MPHCASVTGQDDVTLVRLSPTVESRPAAPTPAFASLEACATWSGGLRPWCPVAGKPEA